jgi:hypothetical protein
MIDEVRIYPRALTDTEVRDHYQREVTRYYDDFGTAANRKTYRYFGVEDSNTSMQPIDPKGTILHYRFNDNSTTNVTDMSGNGFDGNVINGPIWLTNSSCMNNFGGCMFFRSGSATQINASTSALLSPQNITVVVWAASAVNGNTNAFVTKWDGGNANGWRFVLNGNNLVFNIDGNQGPTTIINPRNNTWYFYAATYDHQTIYLYVNGSLVSSTPSNRDISNINTPLQVGAMTDSTNSYYNGLMDEVMIINRSLSADEIYQLYLGGFNRTVGGKWHRVASADDLQSVSFNLTDHDSFDQQDYDQRSLLLSVTQPDSTAPVITVQSPSNTTYSVSSVWANVTISEDVSAVNRSLDSGANVSMTNSTGNWNSNVTGLSDGAHTLTFYTTDSSGNVASPASVGFTVSTAVSISILNINKTFNPLVPWWVEYVNISGYASYTNGTPFSSGSIRMNETNNGRETTLCSVSPSSIGSFYCNFTSKYQVGDTPIGIYAISGGSIIGNTTGIMETKPNYGEKPTGLTSRSVLETPFPIQEPSSVIRTIVARITISRGPPGN